MEEIDSPAYWACFGCNVPMVVEDGAEPPSLRGCCGETFLVRLHTPDGKRNPDFEKRMWDEGRVYLRRL